MLLLGVLLQSSEAFNATLRGSIVWQDEFDAFNKGSWKHLITGWRGGNNEFQYYTDRAENSYVRGGILYIKPTLTADRFSEDFLYNGVLDLNQEGCNIDIDNGCVITAGQEIINPIQSARIVTSDSFSFKYGYVEVRAKMPRGDWIWPAIWFLPTDNVYGGWPLSGEIDLVETRGNNDFSCGGNSLGNNLMGSTLHWGPDPGQNAFFRTHWEKLLQGTDYAADFHVYGVEWLPNVMNFIVDNELIGSVTPPAGGFWELGQFGGQNIWASGTPMAPFDQKFHFVMNVAVGGGFFPDGCVNRPFNKPWNGGGFPQMRPFWEAKTDWLPTWNAASEDNAMQVDYVRVYGCDPWQNC
jgi:beta-glucanase (GH16 family)